jgi:hypothetical protein
MWRGVGTFGALEAAAYPLLTPYYVAIAWFRSLWAARILLDGQWSRYQGFHPQNALTSFFYKTQWLNISRYGRCGTSPVVGLGTYPLSRWFHLTLVSSCLYSNAGAVSTLAGTLAWVTVQFVWLDAAAPLWVVGVGLVFLFSSTAFAMAFTRQNYNILGWMWLPLALYAVLTGCWALAAMAWLAASMASVTVIFAALPLMVVYAVSAHLYEPLFALMPAMLKLMFHLGPLISGGGLRPALANMAKMIGMTSVGVRYKRRSMRLRPFNAYFIVVYAVGCGLLWYDRSLPVLPLAALALFSVNQVLVRFADEQSVIVMFVSVFAAQLMAFPPSVIALVAMSIVANPLPVFLGLCSFERDGTLVRTQTRRPFDHTRLQAGLDEFFSAVPSAARIFMAFDDPKGEYENIFDGYRTLLNLPQFVAASRGVHLFPDWYAVAETNYENAPSCWGRSEQGVLDNSRMWRATHVIVYQDSGADLDHVWANCGLTRLATFDWGQWESELDGVSLWRSACAPCWHLLALPASQAEQSAHCLA